MGTKNSLCLKQYLNDLFPIMKDAFEVSQIDVLCIISQAILYSEILPI